ncbi:ArsR/SmtB family transcription factor [Streptomyces sp. NPDC090073]|uniref:ArsR/SmtB family transcription factor n=1 Tax=Streptomyces sp. NPDC090073 TaxID=3365936 RepID=UPI0037FE2094
MIRLHFSADDLCRITLAPRPEALFETALSVRFLLGATSRQDSRRGELARWRREMSGVSAGRAGILLDLVRHSAYMPDFLLQPSVTSFADGVQSVHSIPDRQLHADLSPLLEPAQGVSVPHTRLPTAGGRLHRLAEGIPQERDALAADLERYHATSIAPLWPHVTAAATADRALRAEMLLRGGVDALLTTLGPSWRWQPPTLHLPSSWDVDVPLCGRGLLLIPSYFATRPVMRYRPDDSTVLMYPMRCPPDTAPADEDALVPLLGRTRATVLAALRTPATTTVLAERTGISLAGASQHASVLRNAGLISTERIGTAVLHTLRPLGQALLDGRR